MFGQLLTAMPAFAFLKYNHTFHNTTQEWPQAQLRAMVQIFSHVCSIYHILLNTKYCIIVGQFSFIMT